MPVTDFESTPSAPGSRARRSAATRRRLRESGLELFAERGFHNVTTHDIAHHAGLAAGTFYLHYSDKQALCTEITERAVADMRERIQTAMLGAIDNEERVTLHATALVDFAAANRTTIQILFSGDASAIEHDVLNTLAESVEKVRTAQGSIPIGVNPGVLSQAVVGMYARVIAWWVEDPSRATREEVIAALTRIQLSGTQPG
ncbi:MAG: TetR/AcrR family transcriptional regulator [Myxococcota bacterium]|nr:TetR/AcrR family transcriptional regulator [Myxococcota bacterium]